MNHPECSIIIVNYHQLNLLDNCIDSVLKYTPDISLEIIVIDNDSKDDAIEKIKEKSPCIKLIRNSENMGFAAANNKGLKCATGKYLLLLNNDTLFLENSLRKLIDFAGKSSEEMIIGCKILNADMSDQVSLVDFDNVINSFSESFFIYKLFRRSKLFNKYYQNYIDINKPTEAEALKGCFLMLTGDMFRKLNFLDERFEFYMDDIDICYRYIENGAKVIYYPETSIIHLGGASTESVQWFKFKHQTIAKIKFYQKHYSGIKYFMLVSLHYTGVFLRVFVYTVQAIFTLKKYLFVKSYYYLKQLFVFPKNVFRS